MQYGFHSYALQIHYGLLVKDIYLELKNDKAWNMTLYNILVKGN